MSNEGTPIQVEPAPEGPLVKPKRPMTEAQLDALKRGREKLAEKRRAAAEEAQAIKPVSEEPVKEDSAKYGLDTKLESDTGSEASTDEAEERAFCSMM
jgi:hypothetical protein